MSNIELEKMYDQMLPGWDNEGPVFTFRIYAIADTKRLGLITLAGHPFRCHLCGADDGWVPEDNRVFICEHEPIGTGRLGCRQISDIPFRLVGRYEEVMQ